LYPIPTASHSTVTRKKQSSIVNLSSKLIGVGKAQNQTRQESLERTLREESGFSVHRRPAPDDMTSGRAEDAIFGDGLVSIFQLFFQIAI